MSYKHPGDAWMDVETLAKRWVYCDACSDYVRQKMRERAETEEDEPPLHPTPRMKADYFDPEADDRCDKCGVIASQQHIEEA